MNKEIKCSVLVEFPVLETDVPKNHFERTIIHSSITHVEKILEENPFIKIVSLFKDDITIKHA